MKISKRIHWGLLTLIFSSLLGVIGLVLRGSVPLPNMDVAAWADAVTDSNYFVAQVLYIFAYILPFFGFWALYALLSKMEKLEKIAFWGFMGAIMGTSLALPTLGIFSFVSPPLAQRYLQGDTQLPDIIIQVATGQPAIINLSGGTIYLIGTILLGVAIWRSNKYYKWAGVLFALHGLFLVIGFTTFSILVLGWVFLFFGGLWVFVGVAKKKW